MTGFNSHYLKELITSNILKIMAGYKLKVERTKGIT